jgi:hypothetical protein
MLRVTVAAGAALQGLAFALQKLRCNHISNSTKAGHQNQARARAVNTLLAIQPHFQKALGPIADSISGRAGKATAAELVDGSQNELEHLLLLRD